MPSYEIVQYGATVNGLCTKSSSDVDLTILVGGNAFHHVVLSKVKSALKKYGGFDSELLKLKNCYLLQIHDNTTDKKFDLTVNADLSIKAAQLFKAYTVNQPTFQKLAVFLKLWNKAKFPNNMDRISSYGIVIMLIAYMQSRQQLPCLQNQAEDYEWVKTV